MILASASAVRARLLRDAGLSFDVITSGVDEEKIKQSAAHFDIETLASRLAEAKARAVSLLHTDAWVIGADQILDCEGTSFDKPVDLVAARAHLGRLRGKTHRLVTACTVFRGNEALWEHVEAPKLTMRAFSEAFLDEYLSKTGENVLSSVGAYQLEGRGAQLFERIEGDYFAILGLPLVPLLSFLRREGLVPA